jgi:hypothetical protein
MAVQATQITICTCIVGSIVKANGGAASKGAKTIF